MKIRFNVVKKLIAALPIIALFYTTSAFSNSPKIRLGNYSNDAILYKTTAMDKKTKEGKLGHNNAIALGKMDPNVADLQISTTKLLSRYTSLKSTLDKIRNEYKGKRIGFCDAIITVNPSDKTWYISHEWELRHRADTPTPGDLNIPVDTCK